MKISSFYSLLFSLSILLGSFAVSATPSLEYSEDACGYVLIINQSSCSQTVFCHEVTGDNKVYNMGSVAPGAQITVYPTSSQARVWSENAQGHQTSTTNTLCTETYIIRVTACSTYTCNSEIVNNACQALQVYTAVNDDWVVVAEVPVGETLDYELTHSGQILIFAYSFNEVLGTVTAECGRTYTINDDCPEECLIYLNNDACEDVLVYVQYANDWAYVGTLSKGQTYSHSSSSGANYLFRYADGTTVATWTGWCGESYTITDQCQTACTVYFQNNACDKVVLFLQKPNAWINLGTINVGSTVSHETTQGAIYVFKYEDGSTIGTWTGWCGESYNITDQCQTACTVFFQNDACDKVELFLQKPNAWINLGTIDVGSTVSHETQTGAIYVFKYLDGSTIGTWTAWCGESYVISDQCVQECNVFFDNNACEDVLAYRQEGNDWVYIGTLDKGVKYQHSTYSGVNFIFRYADGTQVGSWSAWCGETYDITDDCNVACDIFFTNDACDKLHVFAKQSGAWVFIGSLDKGVTSKHSSANGTDYRFAYADGSTVATWKGWCGETFSVTDDCRQACNVTLKNRTCNKLEVLANIDGVLVSKGFLIVGESKSYYVYEGTHFILKNEDGSHAGSWTSECNKLYTAYKECPTECNAYIQNNACQTLKVYKIVNGQSTFVGSVAVGSSLQLYALAGTPYIIRYEDGSTVGEWNLECDKTFTASQTCTTPCDDVQILAIKIFDQVTDAEVPGIGALTEGMVVDADQLPAGYYIAAVVSDATQSVSLVVDGWKVCENYAPYTFPNAAHEGEDWNGGAGDHSVSIDAFAEADCYGTSCQTITINFNISEPSSTCTLQVEASQSAPSCDGMVVLSATSSGASVCCEGEQAAVCGTLATYGGYVLDVEQVSGCADGQGIRLWAAGSSSDATFVTVDLGSTITAGNQICVRMYVKHCLNTDSTSASASIQTSLDRDSGFTSLGGAIFENQDFQDFCFNLSSDTRFVKIVDNGQCSFRVDAVSVTGTSCTSSNAVSYVWSNAAGNTIGTTASIAVNQLGDYNVSVQDCAGCSTSADVTVSSLEGQGCFVPAVGGQLSLANGDTSIDVCIGDGVSDAFDIVLSQQTGEFSAWVVLDAFRNILSIPAGPPFDFENNATEGLCIICHVSFNGELTGFEVGQNANDVMGDIDFSNEISVTKFRTGGPCGGGLFTESSTESRTIDVETTEVKMYPNPVLDILNIETELATGTSIDVEIFSIDGRSVRKSRMAVQKTNQLNISELSGNQFYMIRILQDNKGVMVDRFYKSE